MNTENKSLSIVHREDIKGKIYTIRGVQVMLDRDLAELYKVKTSRLNEQVRRNIKKFPTRFMFQLTEKELKILRSQFATANISTKSRTLPFVFTEQGVSQLSSVLNSEVAIEISIKIIDAFVEMRRFLISNAQIFQRLDTVERNLIEHKVDTDKKFEKVFEALEYNEIKPKQGIFFDGQIFDAHKFVSDIIRKANTSIVIIDNYIDDTVLSLLTKRKENVTATILTKNISKQLQLDIEKHNAQYPPIKVKELKESHDRFIILDEKEVYVIGASLKDVGKKWFAFSKLEADAGMLIERIRKLF